MTMGTGARRMWFVLTLLAVAACAGGPGFPQGPVPSELAAGSFRSDGAFSFRVALDDGWPSLRRTSYRLPVPGRDALPPAYRGDADPVLSIALDDAPAARPAVEQASWDHQRATYRLANGSVATLVVSRLSPAVLVESPARRVTLRAPRPAGFAYVAFVRGGKPVVHRAEGAGELSDDEVALGEPWLLAWFGSATPVRGYVMPADVDDRGGVSKPKLDAGLTEPLDMPLLLRLEHRPNRIATDEGGGLVLTFPEHTGKLAIMPLFGGRAFLPDETEQWADGLPDEVLAQCRLWSAKLRDYPRTVRETFSVDRGNDVVSIRQEFEWLSFADDWGSSPVKAAPIPAMLALALGGGVPVRFYRDGVEAQPVDYRLMDTPGKAMGIEGGDAYEYRITGLGRYVWYERDRSAVQPEARQLQAKLERHVRAMVEAGHLAPLLYIYGGIGGTRFAHYYWVGSPELAHALAMAYPYLSADLQQQVKSYLRSEWQAFAPFEISDRHYTEGAPRAPYEMPWEDIGDHVRLPRIRDMDYRRRSFVLDLYRADEYYQVTGQRDGPEQLRGIAAGLVEPLLERQDWAIMGPGRLETVGDRHRLRYFTLQGQAAYNGWLAGAIGLARLGRRFGWGEQEDLGYYLAGKLAMARAAEARYVPEMHRTGLVRGDEGEDWRSLIHIDTTCALVGWGAAGSGVHQDQELPPFVDLVEEVGLLLGDYAREECRIYLGRLDRDVPFWYLSEAPKLGATEHRTCPLQHQNGNVLAQYWVLGKQGAEFARYVDTTRFRGDLYYIQNLVAAIDSFAAQ